MFSIAPLPLKSTAPFLMTHFPAIAVDDKITALDANENTPTMTHPYEISFVSDESSQPTAHAIDKYTPTTAGTETVLHHIPMPLPNLQLLTRFMFTGH